MSGNRVRLLFLNVGHAYAHYFMLIHPTVAVALESRGQGDYGALLLPATAGFVAFAAFTLPAGWLGDRWSRHGMMAVMFLGLGVASLLTALASGLFQMAAGLFLMGSFAAIYHPVGIALVAESGKGVGQALGVNGVWGNMGVAAAPLVTGALTGMLGWQAAFLVPGALCLASGIAYLVLVPAERGKRGACCPRSWRTPSTVAGMAWSALSAWHRWSLPAPPWRNSSPAGPWTGSRRGN